MKKRTARFRSAKKKGLSRLKKGGGPGQNQGEGGWGALRKCLFPVCLGGEPGEGKTKKGQGGGLAGPLGELG